MGIDFAVISLACDRASAAYAETQQEAEQQFLALGNQVLGYYADDDHQAVLSVDVYGQTFLSISGTRFSQGKIGDLFDDVDLDLVPVGDAADGCKVTRGAYEGLDKMWTWAKSFVANETIFNVEGHSLGAWRTLYTPLFLPAQQIGAIHAFESPKGANAAYWQRYSKELSAAVHVVNQDDIFYGWPELNSEVCHPPVPAIWLHPTGFDCITPDQWPGGLSLEDHRVDNVGRRLRALI